MNYVHVYTNTLVGCPVDKNLIVCNTTPFKNLPEICALLTGSSRTLEGIGRGFIAELQAEAQGTEI